MEPSEKPRLKVIFRRSPDLSEPAWNSYLEGFNRVFNTSFRMESVRAKYSSLFQDFPTMGSWFLKKRRT